MSASQHDEDQLEGHESPIKTPQQLIVTIVFAFVVPVLVIILLVQFVTSSSKPSAGSDGLTGDAVAQRIQRVGTVVVKDPSDVGAMKNGEQVYAAQCVACHGAGVAGAPKLADEAAWAARIKTGYDALLASALKGKGAMGAQGGGDFSDLEIGRAVVYMANKAGAKLDEPKAGGTAPAAKAEAAAAPTAVAAPKAEAAAAAPKAETAAPAPKAEAPAPATKTETAAAAVAPTRYAQSCAACHAAGVAGAPKLGDKAAWAPRLAQGLDGLVASVIKGKGAMPPRGASDASDAEIKETVAYMVSMSK